MLFAIFLKGSILSPCQLNSNNHGPVLLCKAILGIEIVSFCLLQQMEKRDNETTSNQHEC